VVVDNIRNASILIIDDQPVNIKVVEKILVQDGYTEIRSSTDPLDGIKQYQEKRADLVLLDINMPQMNGFQVIEKLRGLDADDIPPVLVLTAQTDRDSRIHALELGARDYLTKPFDRVELLTRIANMLEVGLLQRALHKENLDLEEKVRERTKAIHDTQLEIIRRLGRAAEYKDNETGLHIVRMSKTTVCIAEEIGMNGSQLELLLNASPMHDVGKIGIPDRILLKPGKLTADEWEVMKTHATIGAELLSGHNSELLDTARVIALTHHEKWDGSGYPEGLKGNEIPIEGRIVAIADVFDALTSKRPYKEPWTIDASLDYIRTQSGKHFDPDLVDVFFKREAEILEINSRYADPDLDK